ncbi:MAG: hypothetical protein DRP71_05835 [Verrucomicrobia bacterium]|nr:MAG: hypothetical protein DRP71_05835 [Verrucomicrobiota bacterium]
MKPMSLGALFGMGLFLVPFFLVGAFFLIQGLGKVFQGNGPEGWPMAGFAIVFLSMASGFLSLIVYGYRKSRKTAGLADEFQDAPWMVRSEWAGGVIKAGRGRGVALMWVMAIFWNGVSSPILFVFQREWENGNKAILIGLLFPLIGIGLLVAAVRATMQWRRFGNSELRLKTLPGRIGGVFHAQLAVPGMASSIRQFNLRLTCVRRTTSGSGKNRSTREELLWEDERVAPRQVLSFESTGTCVPVYFRVPADQPESMTGNPAIVWRLEATALLPGVDFEEKFEVPVFNTEPDSVAESAPDPLEGHQDTLDVGVAPNLRGVQIVETLDGVRIHFKPARNPGTTFSLFLITAVWTGIFVVLLKTDAPLMFPFIWAVFDVFLILGLITSLFHGIRIDAADHNLTIKHRLIVPTVTRHYASGEIAEIKAVPGMKSGNTQFYRIAVIPKSGGKSSAGSRIKNKRDAVWIAERLAIAVGL